jgi:cAMP phosphodiesterase
VQKHIFNDVMWPDFVAFSKKMPPFLHICPMNPEMPVEVDGLQITAVPVHHVVPTVGYVVSDGKSAVIFGGDSGPTDLALRIRIP